MALIGVRELREQATEVIRRVREDNAEYVITYQGRPVAILLPIDEDAVTEAIIRASKQAALVPWEAYERLAETLREVMPPGKHTQKTLDEIRGEE
ncbi:MAG TPA: type II toxin-antitoxin system prevent-host-death family antitoxin [Anaerolineales bacterium]|nr:type II toxin-antitoxin system prevent-host-death family antitoxin [Anaerolineales bacterium]